MDFDFTEEQTLLRDSLNGYLGDRYDFETRRKVSASESGWRPEVWTAFAEELGILGASVPEAQGGLGGGAVENLIVMEALGEHLVIEPFLEAVVLSGALLQAAGGERADALLGDTVAGSAIVVSALYEPHGRYGLADVQTTAARSGDGWTLSGAKAHVDAAPWATHLLVSARTGGGRRERDGVSLFLVPADGPGVHRRDYSTLDGRRASELTLENAAAELIGPEGGALPLIEEAVDRATVAACAEAVGLMRRMQQETIAYAKQRKQFGRPIGDFQVLQHRMVDMMIAVEEAVSITYYATLSLGRPAAERARAVSAAKAKVSRNARFVGQQAVQIHGGIGVTEELALGWRFKRASAIETLFGDCDLHTARFERLTDPELA